MVSSLCVSAIVGHRLSNVLQSFAEHCSTNSNIIVKFPMIQAHFHFEFVRNSISRLAIVCNPRFLIGSWHNCNVTLIWCVLFVKQEPARQAPAPTHPTPSAPVVAHSDMTTECVICMDRRVRLRDTYKSFPPEPGVWPS